MTSPLLPLSLCFLLLFHGSLAARHQQKPQQPPRLSGSNWECQIERISAKEPNYHVKSEAGESHFWIPQQNDEFKCVGVEAVLHIINPKGLLLPYYTSAPELIYVVQGEGIQGTVLPDCPETFETSFESEGGKEEFVDKHQKVYRYREGDILALPTGAVHWTYNQGNTPIIVIVFRDTANVANQLDQNFRKFFLAGNPQSAQVQWSTNQDDPERGRGPGSRGQDEPRRGRGPGSRGQDEPGRRPGSRGQDEPGRGHDNRRQDEPERGRGQHEQGGKWEGGQGSRNIREQGEVRLESLNIFNGFGDEILQQVFKVQFDTVRHLKGHDDNRGLIVEAENFQVVTPQEQEREQSSSRQRGGSGHQGNGIEETICSAQLSANIASPVTADVYNPRGGRVNSLNSHKLPALGLLQLSAERGILYKNALLAPHYNLNAHSIVYIISGSSRIQIVRNNGSSVFDGVVRQGQIIVVPQNFVVLKKAEEEGCEWVAFKTNDNAITTQLAGRVSFIRAVPVEVLENSYEISRDQAERLKYNRQEGVVLSPSSGSGSTGQKTRNALLNVLFG